MTSVNDRGRTEFNKYLRYFTSRMVQSLVQSRMGIKISNKCSPEADTNDWFTLKIDEIGEIAAYLKSHVKNYPPNVPSLNLDFWLYFPSGEVMLLETWVLSIDTSIKDDDDSVHRLTYFAMSQLLKSAIAAARVTPTYRYYVHNQSVDNYIIIYRVYEGETDLSLLGENAKSVKLGKFISKFGTVQLELHYRTNMEFFPSIDDARCEEIKESVHKGEVHLFRRPSMPAGIPSIGKTERISPCSPAVVKFSASPLSQEFQFGSQESHGKFGRSVSSSENSYKMRHSETNNKSATSPQTSSSFPQRTNCRRRLRNNSFPFASLLYDSQCSDEERLPKVDEDTDNGNVSSYTINRLNKTTLHTSPSAPGYIDEVTENMSIKESKSSTSLTDSKKPDETPAIVEEEETKEESTNEMESSDDSYVKVFSLGKSTDELGDDLTEFVKEVRLAPSNLGSFAQGTTSTLAEELNVFKEKAAEFDQFITRLKDADDN